MGQLIKFTDKSFLREHPHLEPENFPAPVQEYNGAFIFPGDEIVLWHKLSLPDDISAASISDISFQSVKASIIAEKPQIFTEQFNQVFKSTRKFELDSFTTSFNNSNLAMQLWGTDGYAPNIHLQQDRNWRLPPGDFRRQVNFFTRHTASTSVWDYWFEFPIIFRWEYWLSLVAASDDFFDLPSPQQGKNQWWYHYFVVNRWNIISRLEINCLIQGEPTILRASLNLTNGGGWVNDYNSNTNYIDETIKTSAINGTPSNAPAFIYGNQDTQIVGFLKKDTPWVSGERANISAVVWIEPFEGTGYPVRTRGSSLYQITPESVFKGLSIAATDDSGLGITDGAGAYVVLNATGKGAIVLFDSADVTKITIYAIVDYIKLAIAYPGATKFTVYARLYNKTEILVNPGKNKKGEEIKQDCLLINPKSEDSLCVRREPLCPFNLDVFADLADADDLKNDKSAFYQYGDPSVADIIFVLGKQTNCGPAGSSGGGGGSGGDYNDDYSNDFFNDNVIIANPAATFQSFISGFTGTLTMDDCVGDNLTLLTAITNNNFGNYFPFGKSNDFLNNDFEDDYGKKYSGVLLEWRKVLQTYGVGKYQIFIIKVDAFGNAVVTCDPRTFCLKAYNCNLINRSVRVEFINEGIRGSLFDQTAFIDYAAGWYGQYRLRGVMKYKTSGYVKEYNQYGDSQYNAFKPITNEQQPKFTLSIRPIPGWMDWVLSTDILQADDIKVSDWNTRNRHPIIKMPMMNDGDFTPRDSNLANALADVEIALAYGQNTLRKRNSQ